ncbi:MAG: family 10 glycosylhydrolase [Kiritimatiellae bacterium]|nr:family 10 glycosylhydrolase [Kiritimatiellia bacterium]
MKKILAAFAALIAAFQSFAAAAPRVAIVPCEKGYYTSLAKHLQRWLASEDICSEIVVPEDLAGSLESARMVYFVGFAQENEKDIGRLKRFIGKGGKAAVFYSSSRALADAMGVSLAGYAKASYPGEWSRMVFKGEMKAYAPSTILQTSTVLQRARPLAGRGRTIAVWADRKGKSSGESAVIETDAGWWMTHVMLADGDETHKAVLAASFAGAADPSLWNARASREKAAARHRKTRAFALKQIPRKGEMHAVWDHSGCGLYPGDWPRTMKVLAEARFTDLFVNVAGAGFAHYESSVLPRSKIFVEEGDQLEACIAAAKRHGIRVHAWMLCFTATRSAPGALSSFRRRGWTLKTADGADTEYLDPSNGEVRAYVLDAIEELAARKGLAGVHLDFVRWYEKSARPAGAASYVSRFVSEARKRVRRPLVLSAAVLGKYPSCVASVGQDWPGWIDSGAVDYAVPMDYTESNERFENYLRQHAEVRRRAPRIIAGIGVTANESRLDAEKVIRQILLARKYSLAGVALFDLDHTLEKTVMPYLKLGVW